MREIFIKKPKSTLLQFFRYLIVGGGAAIVDTATLYVLHKTFGVHHLIAAAIGFLLGMLINYLISIAWVFQSTGNMKKELILFGVIGMGGLLWTEVILWISVDLIHIPILISKIFALSLVLIWNFGMRKKFVFTEKRSSPLLQNEL